MHFIAICIRALVEAGGPAPLPLGAAADTKAAAAGVRHQPAFCQAILFMATVFAEKFIRGQRSPGRPGRLPKYLLADFPPNYFY